VRPSETSTRCPLETLLDDLQAVGDHLKLPKFDLFGTVDGAPIAAAYASCNPERVRRLALNVSFAAGRDVGNLDSQRALAELCRTNWKMGRRMLAALVEPSNVSGMLHARDSISMTGEIAAKCLEFIATLDVVDELRHVRVPTIVLHDRGNKSVPYSAGKVVAGLIPDARFVTNHGHSYMSDEIAVTVREFLNEGHELGSSSIAVASPSNVDGDSAFRAVLFTDLVGHTEMMQRLGDERGRDVLREHERITRGVLKSHGGSEIKTGGDGFMMSFGSVTKAIECAIALQRAFATHSEPNAGAEPVEALHVRVGLNAGEPIAEDNDLFGSTVILASRIAAQAGAGEILVPDTVRGLCSGKGFVFADRGEFVPKGFDEAVRLYEVRWPE